MSNRSSLIHRDVLECRPCLESRNPPLPGLASTFSVQGLILHFDLNHRKRVDIAAIISAGDSIGWFSSMIKLPARTEIEPLIGENQMSRAHMVMFTITLDYLPEHTGPLGKLICPPCFVAVVAEFSGGPPQVNFAIRCERLADSGQGYGLPKIKNLITFDGYTNSIQLLKLHLRFLQLPALIKLAAARLLRVRIALGQATLGQAIRSQAAQAYRCQQCNLLLHPLAKSPEIKLLKTRNEL
jgi:hypothetical protein